MRPPIVRRPPTNQNYTRVIHAVESGTTKSGAEADCVNSPPGVEHDLTGGLRP